ncbi:MAG: hypothetical protein U0R26_12020 [Solirubrobacterales bacterium]
MEDTSITVQTSNPARSPELRRSPGGTAICDIRLAVNSRRKDGSSGGGSTSELLQRDLLRHAVAGEECGGVPGEGTTDPGRGRLDWSEWEAKDGSGKRQRAVQIIAGGSPLPRWETRRAEQRPRRAEPEEVPASVGADGGEEDIPF